MKKLFYILAITLSIGVGSIFAQSPSPIHVGVKLGTNFTNISTSLSDYNTKTAAGLLGGATARIDITKFYVQTDLMFATKSVKFENNDIKSIDVKWKSIEVPVTLGYKFIDLPIFKLRAFGGGVYTSIIDNNFTDETVKDLFREFDKSNIGFRAGVGVDINNLNIDVSYDGGLNNISKDFKSKPKVIAVTVGFFFL